MPKMPELAVPGPQRDFVGYGRDVPRVRWPGEARVAVNLVVNYEEGSEVQMRAGWRNESIRGEMALGLEAKYRDLALESVYEYGSRAGVLRLQRLPDARGVPVTVFAGAVTKAVKRFGNSRSWTTSPWAPAGAATRRKARSKRR